MSYMYFHTLNFTMEFLWFRSINQAIFPSKLVMKNNLHGRACYTLTSKHCRPVFPTWSSTANRLELTMFKWHSSCIYSCSEKPEKYMNSEVYACFMYALYRFYFCMTDTVKGQELQKACAFWIVTAAHTTFFMRGFHAHVSWLTGKLLFVGPFSWDWWTVVGCVSWQRCFHELFIGRVSWDTCCAFSWYKYFRGLFIRPFFMGPIPYRI